MLKAVAGYAQRGARTLATVDTSDMTHAGQVLGLAGAVDVGINTVGWGIGAALRTEKNYDVFGSLTFASVSVATLAASRSPGYRELLASFCVIGWAVRLGQFLFRRVLSKGNDSRFDNVRDNPPLLAAYWAIQSVWCYLTPFSVILLNARSPSPASFLATDGVGFALFGFGLAFEWLADAQKSRFKQKEENKGKCMTEGVWAYSRHPNYFGELLLWTGLAIVSSGAIQGSMLLKAAPFISPAFESALILGLSGVPMSEKEQRRKYGGTERYEKYKKETPVLVPFTKPLERFFTSGGEHNDGRQGYQRQ